MASSSTRPAGIGRLRVARPLGALGLLAWLWATAVLPALHAAEHAQEADHHGSHRQAVETLIAEVLWPEDPARPGHSHSSSTDQGHGDGALGHLGVAFAAVPVYLVPPAFQPLERLPEAPAPMTPRRPGHWPAAHPRGPPPAAAC